jgi:transketolase
MPMLRNAPPEQADIGELKRRATNLRRHMLTMARGQGQGYIGQGLGIAELLAALYFHELRYDPQNVAWDQRDRFLLSTGHYSIALWAAFAEAGIILVSELPTYGADDSRLEMSTLDTTPGVEMIGGSLGHGLGQGVGQALGLRLDRSAARVFVELSDGEMQEGSTWEAAMSASHFGLDNLVALIDCNGIQADGAIVLDMEPVAEKWRAFGWDTQEIDGNDRQAIISALAAARAADGRPKAIVLRTVPGKGVKRIEESEKAHFFRIDVAQWDGIIAEFEKSLETAA